MIVSESIFKPGDTFSIELLDMRPWPRFKAWLMRRPPPMTTVYMQIKNTTQSDMSVTVYGNALWVKQVVKGLPAETR